MPHARCSTGTSQSRLRKKPTCRKSSTTLTFVGQDGTGILQIDREPPEHAHLWRPL